MQPPPAVVETGRPLSVRVAAGVGHVTPAGATADSGGPLPPPAAVAAPPLGKDAGAGRPLPKADAATEWRLQTGGSHQAVGAAPADAAPAGRQVEEGRKTSRATMARVEMVGPLPMAAAAGVWRSLPAGAPAGWPVGKGTGSGRPLPAGVGSGLTSATLGCGIVSVQAAGRPLPGRGAAGWLVLVGAAAGAKRPLWEMAAAAAPRPLLGGAAAIATLWESA